AGFTVSGDAYPALLIDKNNLIYAAFADNSRNNRITIKRYNDISDNWETLGSEGFSAGAVRYISLINDEEGTLIAAYQDESKGNKAVVKQWNSGLAHWQALGEEEISAGPAFYLSAAAGPGRQLYLIYKDSWNSVKATVKRYDRPAGRWV